MRNLRHKNCDSSNPGAWIEAEMAPASSRLEFGFLDTPIRGTYRSIDAATNSSGIAAVKAIIQKRRFRVTTIAMVSESTILS